MQFSTVIRKDDLQFGFLSVSYHPPSSSSNHDQFYAHIIRMYVLVCKHADILFMQGTSGSALMKDEKSKSSWISRWLWWPCCFVAFIFTRKHLCFPLLLLSLICSRGLKAEEKEHNFLLVLLWVCFNARRIMYDKQSAMFFISLFSQHHLSSVQHFCNLDILALEN